MLETQYRASRVCRILGNPTAYQTVRILGNSSKSPSELAGEIGVSVPTMSITLHNLRNIDVVRYEPQLNRRIYWVKDVMFISILNNLELFVERMRAQQ